MAGDLQTSFKGPPNSCTSLLPPDPPGPPPLARDAEAEGRPATASYTAPATMEKLRQTGRTTKMLDDAKRLAREGRAVYVVAQTAAHAKHLRRIAGDDADRLGIKLEVPGQTVSNFDWDTLSLRGAHPNCEVLVDHYAIEARYGRLLEMLHRYDPSSAA